MNLYSIVCEAISVALLIVSTLAFAWALIVWTQLRRAMRARSRQKIDACDCGDRERRACPGVWQHGCYLHVCSTELGAKLCCGPDKKEGQE